MKPMAMRLKPGDELFSAISEIAQTNSIEAGVIISLVGSLTEAALRFAGREETIVIPGTLEVVSVTGTVARSGSHIHLSASDKDGITCGGHLMPGSHVYTTIELVILDLSETHKFSREFCPLSGYEELVVTTLSSSP